MNWLHDLAYLFGGAFASNAVPHFVSGVMGRPFQSPFAKPPGKGLSSPLTNVLWAFFNLAVGYVLAYVGHVGRTQTITIVLVALGAVLMSVMLSINFQKKDVG